MINSTFRVISLLSCHLVAGIVSADSPQFIGRSGCATATCHGGLIGSGPAWNSSSSRWESSDPHRSAGNLLLTEQSKRIIAALATKTSNNEEAFSQILQSRCISCHAPEVQSTIKGQSVGAADFRMQLLKGVSCESCHGPASKWFKIHTQPEWSKLNRFDAQIGMLDTESLLARVDNCARCHVGSRAADGMIRDVNHEMIAAGHPPLTFDMHRFERNLPPHWDTSPNSLMALKPAKLVNQAKATRRRVLYNAARLSTERIATSVDQQTFDLSEFDCKACHHQLAPRPISDFAPSNGDLYWNSRLTVGNSLYFQSSELRFDRADLGNRLAMIASQSERRSHDLLELPESDPLTFLKSSLTKVMNDNELRNLIVSDEAHTLAWLDEFEIACEGADFQLAPGGSDQLIRLLKVYGIEKFENVPAKRAISKRSETAKWSAERLEKLCKDVLSIINFDGEQGGK